MKFVDFPPFHARPGRHFVFDDEELVSLILRQAAAIASESIEDEEGREVSIDLAIGSPSPLLRDHILDGLLESKAREQLGLLLSARRTK